MEGDDEVQDFRARLKTLQNVAIEITSVLEDQNKKLEDNDTLLQRSITRVQGSLRKMSQMGTKRFNANVYLILAALVLVVLLYLLFIAL